MGSLAEYFRRERRIENPQANVEEVLPKIVYHDTRFHSYQYSEERTFALIQAATKEAFAKKSLPPVLLETFRGVTRKITQKVAGLLYLQERDFKREITRALDDAFCDDTSLWLRRNPPREGLSDAQRAILTT